MRNCFRITLRKIHVTQESSVYKKCLSMRYEWQGYRALVWLEYRFLAKRKIISFILSQTVIFSWLFIIIIIIMLFICNLRSPHSNLINANASNFQQYCRSQIITFVYDLHISLIALTMFWWWHFQTWWWQLVTVGGDTSSFGGDSSREPLSWRHICNCIQLLCITHILLTEMRIGKVIININYLHLYRMISVG